MRVCTGKHGQRSERRGSPGDVESPTLAACNPSRLLIVRNDRLGDLVLTLPTLEYARKLFPAARISLLTGQRTSAVVDRNPHVDEVLKDDGSCSAWQLAKRLRAGRYDAALVVNASTRNYLAVWLAGIPVRVTWSRRPMGWLLGNRHVTLRRSHPPVHESEFALAFIRNLGTDPSIQPSVPRLLPDPLVIERIGARIRGDLGGRRPRFAVHPGNYRSAWNWPPERYVRLITELAAHGGVVVTGGPGEEGLIQQLREGLGDSVAHRVAFYLDLSLEELCATLSLVDVLTVSSTGPMHLAGVLGTPVVALFSSQLWQCPEKWAPLGDRTMILQAPPLPDADVRISPEEIHAHMCLITLEAVVEANLQQLAVPPGRTLACA